MRNKKMKKMASASQNQLVRSTLYISLLCIVSVFGACGGSGGPEGSSQRGVRVLHASIEAAPVDLFSSVQEEALVSQGFFAGEARYIQLANEPQRLSVTRALSASNVVASLDVDGAQIEKSTILLYGDRGTLGLRVKLFDDVVPEAIEGGVVKFIHGLVGASAISVTGYQDGGILFETTLDFGEVSNYLDIPKEGNVELVVHRVVDGKLVESPSLAFEPGGAYTALVTGEVDYYTKTVLYRDN
jgi:hypothetical protein